MADSYSHYPLWDRDVRNKKNCLSRIVELVELIILDIFVFILCRVKLPQIVLLGHFQPKTGNVVAIF